MSQTCQAERAAVVDRVDENDGRWFDMLSRMQERHFWYAGRHRFLLHAVRRHLGRCDGLARPPRVIDLGGGCGGWLAYLLRKQFAARELALADSSELALRKSHEVLPDEVGRYPIDLLRLEWEARWEAAFLLDVLEHIPRQEQALGEVRRALVPGGLLFVTTPALNCFWTRNDDWVGHQRRYAKADYRRLADQCGYRLLDVRYFMFFLSPLLLVSRLAGRGKVGGLSEDELWRLLEKSHAVPHPAINTLLTAVFGAETPLGHYLPFPWGTSILAVLQRPG